MARGAGERASTRSQMRTLARAALAFVLLGPLAVALGGCGQKEKDPAPQFTVEATHGERLRAAVDGEPIALESPIELKIEPRALRVLVPDTPE